jgi:dienelactone hydrolase
MNNYAQQAGHYLTLVLFFLIAFTTTTAAAHTPGTVPRTTPAITPATTPASKPALRAKATVLAGDDPSIQASGLQPGEIVRIHLLRKLTRWQPGANGGAWAPVEVTLHGWAEFAANGAGEVNVAGSAPLRGTYRAPSGVALAWSGIVRGDARLKGVAPDGIYELPTPAGLPKIGHTLHLQRGESLVASAAYTPEGEAPATQFTEVVPAEGAMDKPSRLAGVFAAPQGARGLPTVIILHGSEGGSLDKARAAAAFYVARGFAAFGLVYFARSFEGVKGVTTDHVDIPLSLLDDARAWLAARAEVDASKIGLFGVSKGAEFALLGAATYPQWVKSVVACVPTDVVWEGYAEGLWSTGKSSWQHAGKPLPFIPLYTGEPSKYRDNTERYSNSRRDNPERAKAARIPVENIAASTLLIGGDRDEVWASGDMSRSVHSALRASKPTLKVQLLTFPTAGHMICGNPDFPIEAYGKQSADPTFKVLIDEGVATEKASAAALEFLRSTLLAK